MIRIFPVYNEQSKANLVDAAIIAPRAVSPVTGVSVMTSPLPFGKRVDLLGISTCEALLASGAIDQCDSIDASVFMDTVYIKDVSRGVLAFNMANIATSHFVASVGSFRDVVLDQTFRLTSEDGKTWVSFSLAGSVNLELGSIELLAKLTGASNDLVLDQLQAVGYDVQAFRSNPNRRPHGRTKAENAAITG